MIKQSLKSFAEIPGPPRFPLIGNLHLYKNGKFHVNKYHEVLQHLYRSYGPLVRQQLGTNTIIHVFHPDDIQNVYRSENHTPHVAPLLEASKLYRAEKRMSLGLGNTNGEEWYRLRSAVRKMMLRPNEVQYYLPFVQNVANDFVQRLREKKHFDGKVNDLSLEVGKWAMESAGCVCFEERLGCMSGGDPEYRSEAMIKTNREIFRRSTQLKFSLPIYKYVPTPQWKKLLKAEDLYYRIALKYIKNTIKKVKKIIDEKKTLNGKYNFMAFLLSRKDLNIQDVVILTFSLFSDGLSTTVPALLYNLYCLSIHTDIQEKVRTEVIKIMENNKEIAADNLHNLTYLRAFVKETFRFFPIGTEISRIPQKDLILSGYKIPTGSHLELSPNVHFFSEKYFENPRMFQPERWIKTEGQAQIHPYIMTPFGHGTRTCIGRRFAEQDLYVVLTKILQNFYLEYQDTKPLEQVYETLLFPDGPVKIKFIPRTLYEN